jgi:hypothetical protein
LMIDDERLLLLVRCVDFLKKYIRRKQFYKIVSTDDCTKS